MARISVYGYRSEHTHQVTHVRVRRVSGGSRMVLTLKCGHEIEKPASRPVPLHQKCPQKCPKPTRW